MMALGPLSVPCGGIFQRQQSVKNQARAFPPVQSLLSETTSMKPTTEALFIYTAKGKHICHLLLVLGAADGKRCSLQAGHCSSCNPRLALCHSVKVATQSNVEELMGCRWAEKERTGFVQLGSVWPAAMPAGKALAATFCLQHLSRG